jgi:ABC-type transporter Mla MlaB component
VAKSARSPATLVIRGPLERSDLPGLYARTCELLADRRGVTVLCDVRDLASDAVSADALARLQLAARRRDCRIRLRNASGELTDLLAFMGLQDVLVE